MRDPRTFASRHIGPRNSDIAAMLGTLGLKSLDELVTQTIPDDLLLGRSLSLPEARSEVQSLSVLAEYAAQNTVSRSLIGQGYYGTHLPPVIQRNILENPGWYTAYTPYQAEISQGRLEALVVFETMVQDLTGLSVANAALLDEGTAAAEAMTMAKRLHKKKHAAFFISSSCHPQTIAVVKGRADALGIPLIIADHRTFDFSTPVFGALVQYPDTNGAVFDYSAFAEAVHQQHGLLIAAADLLALTLLRPPGEWGADIAIGSTQRFGVPMGFGGPHAAYMVTHSKNVRKMPGRIIALSKDRRGAPAYRMALQTREQHIRREKATSNVCTSQVLLAVLAAMYAVYHGPDGLKRIASRVSTFTHRLGEALRAAGFKLGSVDYFDTLTLHLGPQTPLVYERLRAAGFTARWVDESTLGVSLDETVTEAELQALAALFEVSLCADPPTLSEFFHRHSDFLSDPVFHRYQSETEMMRYLHRLEVKDLALNTAMIPLGSCTMKLNAVSQMIPIGFSGFSQLHPFAPAEDHAGYQRLFVELERWLAEITGYDAVSLQPNAGSQGEYAGLLAIRAYHTSRGESHRDICLIPTSAHGTNPASAVLAGLKVVAVACDDEGNIDVDDLRQKAQDHRGTLCAIMVTYPSTHGVFETSIRAICEIVHENGGQVYLDGANLNAMVGLCGPGYFGADVSHLNLHKTFAIPHGGGGPGAGPIGVKAHLAPFLPGHSEVDLAHQVGISPVSAAPWGSASIYPISWSYIAQLGPEGLAQSSKVAILSANYMAKRIDAAFPVLYRGKNGRVAHECIIDCRPAKAETGVDVTDIAKRLMDYGFHGPTMSWPVPGTLMIEPTESESLIEIDRFCDALIAIRAEIDAIREGRADKEDNVLKNAPHTVDEVGADQWDHVYGREEAAFPTEHCRAHKFWPTVSRVNDAWGDRNLKTTL